jgi:hypothetical protein
MWLLRVLRSSFPSKRMHGAKHTFGGGDRPAATPSVSPGPNLPHMYAPISARVDNNGLPPVLQCCTIFVCLFPLVSFASHVFFVVVQHVTDANGFCCRPMLGAVTSNDTGFGTADRPELYTGNDFPGPGYYVHRDGEFGKHTRAGVIATADGSVAAKQYSGEAFVAKGVLGPGTQSLLAAITAPAT